MGEDVLKELGDIKQTLTSLAARVRQLEQRLPNATPVSPVTRPTPPPAPGLRPVIPPIASAPPQKSPRQERENLELTIGRYWLNRVGIFSLVLGVAFFILYSFQYVGAAAKIGIGFAIGAGLLGAGMWLERRAGLAWYARGLIGGGWAVTYFTTYAMHHLPTVRILPNALADLVLLSLVAAGAVRHALAHRSQAITALAFSLGFITTSISHVTYFTLASSALLVVALALVAVRMRWHGLLLFGVLGSYLTHVFWVDGQIAMSPAVAVHVATAAAAQFWLRAGFLLLYWVVYTIAIVMCDEETVDRRNALLTAALVNGLMAVTRLTAAMEPLYAQAQYLALLSFGIVYAGLSPVAQVRRLPALSTAHLLLGLTLMTLAIPERLSDRWTSVLWTMEVASLAWLGLRYGRWAYRVFAFGLGVLVFSRLLMDDLMTRETIMLLGSAVPWRSFIGLIGIGSFCAAASCYRLQAYRANQRPIERPAFHLYVAATSVLAWLLTMLEGRRDLLCWWWALEAGAMVGLGWRLGDRALRMFGAVWFATVGFGVFTDFLLEPSGWNRWATAGVIGVLYAIAVLYRSTPPGETFSIERTLRHAYGAAASLTLTALLWREVESRWLSPAWAAEGLALVAVGFLLQDKVFRVSGLGVFGLLVLKILIVDLAGAETIYRILSFIAAGLILLAASYAYARFSAKRAPPKTS